MFTEPRTAGSAPNRRAIRHSPRLVKFIDVVAAVPNVCVKTNKGISHVAVSRSPRLSADGDALSLRTRRASIVGHDQPHGIRALETVNVSRRDTGAGRAIAEVPSIADNAAIEIARACCIDTARQPIAGNGE